MNWDMMDKCEKLFDQYEIRPVLGVIPFNKDKDLLSSASPLLHIDKIKVPLFIAQGANDQRVKKSESDQIVEALQKAGVDVPYMVKDDEGHGFYNEENQFDFYRAMEKFLNKHMN